MFIQITSVQELPQYLLISHWRLGWTSLETAGISRPMFSNRSYCTVLSNVSWTNWFGPFFPSCGFYCNWYGAAVIFLLQVYPTLLPTVLALFRLPLLSAGVCGLDELWCIMTDSLWSEDAESAEIFLCLILHIICMIIFQLRFFFRNLVCLIMASVFWYTTRMLMFVI